MPTLSVCLFPLCPTIQSVIKLGSGALVRYPPPPLAYPVYAQAGSLGIAVNDRC